jgi:hypothetical protein
VTQKEKRLETFSLIVDFISGPLGLEHGDKGFFE